MRIVHVAPRLRDPSTGYPPAVQGFARAQAERCGGHVQAVAAAAVAHQWRVDDLELRTLPVAFPRWLGRSRALHDHLLRHPCELLHVHGLGERALHHAHRAAQRHGAALVVAPAGGLGLGGAERLHLRCALQRLLVHPQALEQAAGWHATSLEEADAIRACGFRQPICVAPPGVSIPSDELLASARACWCQRLPALAGRPVALAQAAEADAGRIARLCTAWAAAGVSEWRLLIVAAQAADVAGIASVPAGLGLDDQVIVTGPGEYPPHGVARLHLALGSTRAAFQPVATALAAGLPVLADDDLPWHRLTVEQAGWCVPRSEFAAALARLLRAPLDELTAHGRNARSLAVRELNWTRSAELLLAFYRHLLR